MEAHRRIAEHPLLASARRRLRRAWLLGTLQWYAPVLAVAAAVLAASSWFAPVPWAAPVAVGGSLAAVAGIALRGVASRVPLSAAATALDRGLAADDVIATALELDAAVGPGPARAPSTTGSADPGPIACATEPAGEAGATEPVGEAGATEPVGEAGDAPVRELFARRVRAKALAVLDRGDARTALPIPVQAGRLAVAGGTGALAFLLFLGTSPQDLAGDRRRAIRAALDQEADALRAVARRAAAAAQSPEQRRLAARLDDEADALTRSGSLSAASARLREVAAELATAEGAESLSRRAAVSGLERSLTRRPLETAAPGSSQASAGASGAPTGAAPRAARPSAEAGSAPAAAASPETTSPSAPQQLRDAAASLREGPLASKPASELAERMAALASTQQVGDANTAQAMRETAAALRDGQPSAAADALDRAAAGHEAAQQREADAERARDAAGAMAQAADRLDARGRPPGAGAGEPSTGASARPAAAGTERRPDAGPPSGQRGGSSGTPSGGGGGASSGTGSGTGGRGQAGTGASGQARARGSGTAVAAKAPVFAPAGGTALRLGGSGDGDGDLIDRVRGPVQPGVARVEAAQALPEYAAEAGRALDALRVSASQRAVVRAYFDSLSTAAGTVAVSDEPSPGAPPEPSPDRNPSNGGSP